MRKPLKPHEVRQVVEHLGFQLKNSEGSHWHYKKQGVGKVTIPHYHEISEDLFGWICKQMKITKKQFWDIFDRF